MDGGEESDNSSSCIVPSLVLSLTLGNCPVSIRCSMYSVIPSSWSNDCPAPLLVMTLALALVLTLPLSPGTIGCWDGGACVGK